MPTIKSDDEANLRYCINGRFLTMRMTGVQRYAYELIAKLDGMLENGEACVLVPKDAVLINTPAYQNIKLVSCGKRNGYLWEQIDLYSFAKRHRLLAINLCSTAPALDPGIVCIHDMNTRANPSFFNWKFRLVYRVFYNIFSRRAKCVLTVSDFSKREIERYYPAAKGKVEVVPNAWQHIERIEPDLSVLDRSSLKPGSYFFAMSSLAPNKNLRWIVETARLNPSETFAVAGGINGKVFGEHEIPRADNVKYLGYVSDGEAKALMANCKCFLYPTFYEGFGIPPMEALASGAPAVAVSDTEVMHEVYGDSALYLDPKKPCSNMNKMLYARNDAARYPLKQYSWAASAKLLFDAMRKHSEKAAVK